MGVENALKTTPTGNNSKKSFQVGFSFIYFNKKRRNFMIDLKGPDGKIEFRLTHDAFSTMKMIVKI